MDTITFAQQQRCDARLHLCLLLRPCVSRMDSDTAAVRRRCRVAGAREFTVWRQYGPGWRLRLREWYMGDRGGQTDVPSPDDRNPM